MHSRYRLCVSPSLSYSVSPSFHWRKLRAKFCWFLLPFLSRICVPLRSHSPTHTLSHFSLSATSHRCLCCIWRVFPVHFDFWALCLCLHIINMENVSRKKQQQQQQKEWRQRQWQQKRVSSPRCHSSWDSCSRLCTHTTHSCVHYPRTLHTFITICRIHMHTSFLSVCAQCFRCILNKNLHIFSMDFVVFLELPQFFVCLLHFLWYFSRIYCFPHTRTPTRKFLTSNMRAPAICLHIQKFQKNKRKNIWKFSCLAVFLFGWMNACGSSCFSGFKQYFEMNTLIFNVLAMFGRYIFGIFRNFTRFLMYSMFFMSLYFLYFWYEFLYSE